MLVIIYLLNEHNILNLKYFFISAAFSTLIVSLDVIYQYIFGVNIIGLISHGHHNSGFFGDELIAGGFIQNFSFFLILFVTLILKNKNYLRFILTTDYSMYFRYKHHAFRKQNAINFIFIWIIVGFFIQ